MAEAINSTASDIIILKSNTNTFFLLLPVIIYVLIQKEEGTIKYYEVKNREI
jgi:hypothetical protein